MRWTMLTILMMIPLAAAAGIVQVQEAFGDVAFEEQAAPSPIPGWCYWDYPATEDGSYGVTEADADGSYCAFPWLAHCDGDSLVFRGSWGPMADSPYLLHTHYDVTLTCRVLLAETTRLVASRQFTDGIANDEHSLTLTLPDETVLPILAADGGADEVEIDLEPGVYVVGLRVVAWGYPEWPAYEGSVVLRWSPPDGTPVEAASWASVRARFR